MKPPKFFRITNAAAEPFFNGRRSFVKKAGAITLLSLFFDVRKLFATGNAKRSSIQLAGTWGFRLDPENKGIDERWYLYPFRNFLRLPGSLQAQGYGNNITENTSWWSGPITSLWKLSPIYAKFRRPGHIKIFEWLQPQKHYIGAAWYSREFDVPEQWSGKRIHLFLERVHWASQVYINGYNAGSAMYLGVPHEFDISKLYRTGKNRLVIRVDNSRIVDIGDNAHSVSDQTQTAWNGIAGEISITCHSNIRIERVAVYPDIARKKVSLNATIGNSALSHTAAVLSIYARSYNTGKDDVLPVLKKGLQLKGEKHMVVEQEYDMGEDPQLWDEFTPSLYKLFISIEVASKGIIEEKEVAFGMREICRNGRNLLLNGKAVFLRGNVDCAVFPYNGYPETDIDWWRKILKKHKAWGFNLVRFHSWCPPGAAFTAADEVGIYLQPEAGEWAVIAKQDQVNFLCKESEAILEAYGNHPSFLMMALGNELRATAEILKLFLQRWKKDPRRLYSGKINGNPVIEEFDFFCSRQSPKRNRLRYVNGWPPTPAVSDFYKYVPATNINYRQAVLDYPRPMLAHETGQRCMYPDIINQPGKFTGSLKAAYLDIAREQLEERGMLEQVRDFVSASGQWQKELYKEEFEAGFRTEGLAGFHFLSLIDFPGQQTAPVGVLDYFYGTKGHITEQQFRRFCNHTVLLAEMEKRTWFNNETFSFTIKLFNFSGRDIPHAKLQIRISTSSGIAHGYPLTVVPCAKHGTVTDAGSFLWDMSSIRDAGKFNLSVQLIVAHLQEDITNDWDFWIYPSEIPVADEKGIFIAQEFDKAAADKLKEGETVLLLPRRQDLKGNLGPCFTSFYWTAMGLTGGESSAGGLLTRPQHPVFNYFPTDFHSNWQWWELLTNASPMVLDAFDTKTPWPLSYRPLIQMIPSWKLNRKLAVLAEATVDKGKLMLCSMDISTDLSERKVAAWFRYSLLSYLQSEDFNPETEITAAMLSAVFEKGSSNNLRLLQAKITASSEAPQHPVLNLLDGNRQTFWSSIPGKNSAAPHLEIDLKQELSLKGIRCTPVTKDSAFQRAKTFKLYSAQENGQFQNVLLEGTFPDREEPADLLFDRSYVTRYLKLEVYKAYPGQDSIAIAELDILPTDTLPFEG